MSLNAKAIDYDAIVSIDYERKKASSRCSNARLRFRRVRRTNKHPRHWNEMVAYTMCTGYRTRRQSHCNNIIIIIIKRFLNAVSGRTSYCLNSTGRHAARLPYAAAARERLCELAYEKKKTWWALPVFADPTRKRRIFPSRFVFYFLI